MKEYFLKRPMLLSGMLSCITVFLGFYSKLLLTAFAVFISVLIFCLIVLRKNAKYIIALIITLLVIISVTSVNVKIELLSGYSGTEEKCSFTVKEITYRSSSYCSADIEITDSDKLKRGTKIALHYNTDILEIGDNATALLSFTDIKNDDYKSFYYSNGNFLVASAEDIKINKTKNDIVLKTVLNIRNYIKDTIFGNLSFNNAATVIALVLGDDSFFTDEFKKETKAAGVSHVMVVSGMHLSLTVMVATYFIEKIVYNKYFKSIVIILVVIFMIGVCGFTASMMRAGVTYFIMALSFLVNRRAEPVNALGGAVSLILIASPYILLSVGFELSVLATLGIVTLAQPIIKYTEATKLSKHKLLFSVYSGAVITLSATLLTLPISIFAFECISVFSVISNLAISFAVNLALWSCLLGIILSLFSSDLATAAFNICELVTEFVNKAISFFGGFEFSTVNVPKKYALAAVFVIFLIIYVLLACKNREKMLKLKKLSNRP